MRIAFLPQVSVPSLLGDSAFKEMLQYAELFSKKGATCYIFCPLAQVKKERLPVIDRVHFIDWPGIGSFYGAHPDLTTLYKWIHPRVGKLDLDMIISSQVYLTQVVQGWMVDAGAWYNRPLYVIDDLMAFGPYNPTSKAYFGGSTSIGGDYMPDMAEVRNMAYPLADRIYWDTELEYETALDGMRRALSPNMMQLVAKKHRIIPVGVDLTGLDEIRETTKKHDEFTLFFGGRLNQLKRPELMLREYVYHVAYGRPPRIVITTPKTDSPFYNKLTEQEKELLTFKTNLPPQEFQREAAACHVLLYPSKGEGFTVGTLEMIMLGLVPIIPDTKWSRALFGASLDQYPYAFTSTNQIQGMLLHVKENYQDAFDKAGLLREYIRENYSIEKCSTEMWDDLVSLAEAPMENVYRYTEKEKGKASSAKNLILEVAKSIPGSFYMEELLEEVAKQSKALKPDSILKPGGLSRRYVSRVGIMRMLKRYGVATPVEYSGVVLDESYPGPVYVKLTEET